MHTEVFDNIDTLIKMADSPLNIDEINTELITLNRNIKNKQNEIEDFKSLITESRYFNASNELVDKNIEISLKHKINRLNRKIKDIKKEIDEVKNTEKSIYDDIEALKGRLKKNESYVVTLEEKAKQSSNNTYYVELLNKEQNSVKELKEELENKNKQYNNVLKELELNNQAYNELNEKLNTEKNRLNDIEDNLKNPNAYIDDDLKQQDDEKLKTLNQELENLEKRKIELLTDANMIGTDAKEFILNNNIIDALSKIRELVTIVKSKPYMDINTPSVLDEELDKKENLRMELSTLIDNKTYQDVDNDTVNKRLDYIKLAIENNNKTISNYQNEIKNIDEFVSSTLGPTIDELEGNILKLEKTIHSYRSMLEDKSKPQKQRTALESAITKKDKEKNVLNEILNAYKNNLVLKIDDTNKINELINSLQDENNKFNKEAMNLSRVSLYDLKTKDLIEEEEDKEKLKQINDDIKAIKNRQKFDKTPDEIYDEIDMYLASISPEIENVKAPNISREEKNKSLNIDDLLNENNKVIENNEKQDKELNNIKEDLIKETEVPEEVLFQDEVPKLKVVQVIPVNSTRGGK